MENQNNVNLVGKLIELKKAWISQEHVMTEGIIQVIRSSGYVDCLPVLFLDVEATVGSILQINGQFRSRDIDNNGKLKVELYIYAKNVSVVSSEDNINDVELEGYVCKKPILRTTPSGKQISDLLVACNFNKDKTAYIPVVVWGKCARKVGKYSVGTKIKIQGRMQCRKYTKVVDNEVKDFVAYELSANSVEEV